MHKETFDKTAFKHQSLAEAAHNLTFWKKQTLKKRLQAANYLNSVAYNFDINDPPKMDKSYFEIRIRENE